MGDVEQGNDHQRTRYPDGTRMGPMVMEQQNKNTKDEQSHLGAHMAASGTRKRLRQQAAGGRQAAGRGGSGSRNGSWVAVVASTSPAYHTGKLDTVHLFPTLPSSPMLLLRKSWSPRARRRRVGGTSVLRNKQNLAICIRQIHHIVLKNHRGSWRQATPLAPQAQHAKSWIQP